MEVVGEYLIHAGREAVWRALNDPAVLEQCIPGCDSLTRVGDGDFEAMVTAAIGPVRAKFRTALRLEDLNPPESYRLVGESKAAAGFGSGSASVRLEEAAEGTRLRYKADFKVGGKLAQVGSRLVLGATRKLADDFFAAFARHLDPGTARVDEPTAAPERGRHRGPWPLAAGVLVVLLILWILLG